MASNDLAGTFDANSKSFAYLLKRKPLLSQRQCLTLSSEHNLMALGSGHSVLVTLVPGTLTTLNSFSGSSRLSFSSSSRASFDNVEELTVSITVSG